MLFTIQTSQLKLAAQRLQGCLSEKAHAYLGIKAEVEVLTFTMADSYRAIFSSHEAHTLQRGGMTHVQGRLFIDLIKELQEGIVEIALEGNFLSVRSADSGHFVFKLPVLEREWLRSEALNPGPRVVLNSELLKYFIDQPNLCILNESARHYAVMGYLHRIGPEYLRLVGSDGFRLSYADIKGDFPEGFLEKGLSLPKKALMELQRVASEDFSELAISVDHHSESLLVELPNLIVGLRMGSLNYPKYQSILPKFADLSWVSLPRLNMVSMIRRVLLAADKTRALALNFSKSELTLRSRSPGSSEGFESLPLPFYEGPELELIVNGRYLADALQNLSKSEDVLFGFSGKEQPLVVSPAEESSDLRLRHILVPIDARE